MKAIGWLIGILLLVIVGLGVYVVMNSGSLIKTAVETYGPRYLGVDVQLGSADISVTDGTGELRGLVIGNPQGFDGQYAFKLGAIKLGIDPMAQSETLIRVRDIEIDSADLAMIAKGTDTNLQALMAHLSSDSGTESAAEESAGPEPKIIIENFAFTNARTSLSSDILGDKAVEIPDIRLTGIGEKSQGVTIKEALKELLSPIVQASTRALAKESLNVDELKAEAEERLDKELKERVGTNLEGVKGLFDR